MLLGAVIVVLLAAGVWRLATRQYYQGVLCAAAALGPAGLLPVLIGTAGWRFYRRQTGAALSAAAGAVVIAAATIAAAAVQSRYAGVPMIRWSLALALWVAMAVGVFYNSVYSYLGKRRMAALMVMRCMAILSLLLILFKPALSYTSEATTGKPELLIAVDRSGSMGVTDDPAMGDRYSQAISQAQLPALPDRADVPPDLGPFRQAVRAGQHV